MRDEADSRSICGESFYSFGIIDTEGRERSFVGPKIYGFILNPPDAATKQDLCSLRICDTFESFDPNREQFDEVRRILNTDNISVGSSNIRARLLWAVHCKRK